MLPVCDVGAAAAPAVLGLLTVTAVFFRTTREPNAPPPPRVPTLLSQLSVFALFTPPAEAPCERILHETLKYLLLTRWPF